MRSNARARLATIALALLAIVVGAILIRERPPTSSPSPAPPPVVEANEAPPTPPTPEASEEARSPRIATATAEEPATAGPAKEDSRPPLTEVRGRLLLPDGRGPAVGAQVRLVGWQANRERVLRHGMPEDWSDLESVTTDDGRFSFRFDPPRAFQFTLDANLAPFATASWRWSELAVGEIVELGDVTLTATGSIAGRVVDRAGKPATGGWHVYADAEYRQRGAGGDSTRVHGPVNDETGEFLLKDVPPGLVRLKAQSRIANWVDGPVVTVIAGEVARADIVYEGPDIRRRIVVHSFTGPFHRFDGRVEGITLIGSPRGPLVGKPIERSRQSWSFDDLEPGTYSIEIRDPRFRPWTRTGVRPGNSVDAQLTGSAAITLFVVDGDGNAVPDYQLKIRYASGTGESLGSTRRTPEMRSYEGLIPGDCVLIVDAPGQASCETVVDDLGPGETRAVTARLETGATVKGVVLLADGRTPAAGAKVGFYPAGIGEAFGRIEIPFEAYAGLATDSEGAFSFSRVASGSHRLVAGQGSLVTAETSVVVNGSTSPDPLRIVLPAYGYLDGRILGPPGTVISGMSVNARPDQEHPRDPGHWFIHRPPSSRVAADGSFRVGPLPVGWVVVSGQLDTGDLSHGFAFKTESAAPGVELGRVEIRGGADTAAEFDLRARFPGALLVSATIDGRPATGFVVETSGELGESGAQVGADGTARIAPLFPGRWIVWLRPVTNEWTISSDPVVVPPGGEASARIDVSLVDGTLRVLDAESGTPLAERVVRMRSARPMQGAVSFSDTTAKSDGDGTASFRLPAATYALVDLADGTARVPFEENAVEVVWPPPDGPPPEFRLRKTKPRKSPGR